MSSRIHVGTLLRLCFKPLGSGLLVLLYPGLLWDGTEDKALSLWNGSTDSKTLDYQRNNPAAAAAKSLQSCPTLCDPIDGSPPGSAVPGILQARTLEWVAISFSNA